MKTSGRHDAVRVTSRDIVNSTQVEGAQHPTGSHVSAQTLTDVSLAGNESHGDRRSSLCLPGRSNDPGTR